MKKWIPIPGALASAIALFVYASLVSFFFAAIMPFVGELIERAPRLGWLAMLLVWIAPTLGAAAAHRVGHGVLDLADTRKVARSATSLWAGFVAWAAILVVSLTTSFVMLVIDPPPADPDFAVAGALANLDVLHHGLSTWRAVVNLVVWISLATGVYTLERAARRDV